MYLGPDGKLLPRPPRRAEGGGRPGDGPGPGPGPRAARAGRPWADLVRPAARLAREGFPVSATLARSLNAQLFADAAVDVAGVTEDLGPGADRLADFPESVAAFRKPDGTPWQAGDRLVQPDLADTLDRIADRGADEFYTGQTARLIAAHCAGHGGLITLDDLAAYRAIERPAVHATFRGFDVYGMGPPASGGILIVEMLNILERFDLKADGPQLAADPPSRRPRRCAGRFYTRATAIADPDFVDVPVAEPDLEGRTPTSWPRRSPTAPRPAPSLAPFPIADAEGADTTHLSTIDGDGQRRGADLHARRGLRLQGGGRRRGVPAQQRDGRLQPHPRPHRHRGPDRHRRQPDRPRQADAQLAVPDDRPEGRQGPARHRLARAAGRSPTRRSGSSSTSWNSAWSPREAVGRPADASRLVPRRPRRSKGRPGPRRRWPTCRRWAIGSGRRHPGGCAHDRRRPGDGDDHGVPDLAGRRRGPRGTDGTSSAWRGCSGRRSASGRDSGGRRHEWVGVEVEPEPSGEDVAVDGGRGRPRPAGERRAPHARGVTPMSERSRSVSPTILLRISDGTFHMHRSFNDFSRPIRSAEAFAGAGFSVSMISATGRFLMGFEPEDAAGRGLTPGSIRAGFPGPAGAEARKIGENRGDPGDDPDFSCMFPHASVENDRQEPRSSAPTGGRGRPARSAGQRPPDRRSNTSHGQESRPEGRRAEGRRPTPEPAAAAAEKAAARPKAATKAEIYAAIAEKTGLSKKEVAGVFDAMSELIGKELGKKGPGLFVDPRPAQAQGRPQAGHQGQAGHQPLHQGADDDQGQAGPQRHQGPVLKALKDLV